MDRTRQASWTGAELEQLFTAYFGEKLSPPEIERLAADVADALADRRSALTGPKSPLATSRQPAKPAVEPRPAATLSLRAPLAIPLD